MQVLREGKLGGAQLYTGLDLIEGGWAVDQHFFSPGRFAETLVAMHQLQIDRAIGIGPSTTALIRQRRMQVSGDAGSMVIDLSSSSTQANAAGFHLTGARLSYLDGGDQLDLAKTLLIPHTTKLDGFEIVPGASGDARSFKNSNAFPEMFHPDRLRQLMVSALESEQGQSIGVTGVDGAGESSGFVFRIYTREDTFGGLKADAGEPRYTIANMYLDVMPARSFRAE